MYIASLLLLVNKEDVKLLSQIEGSFTINVSRNSVKNKYIFSFLENYNDEIFLFKESGGIYFNKELSFEQKSLFSDFVKLEDIKEKKNLIFKNTYKKNITINPDKENFINTVPYTIMGNFKNKILPENIYILFSDNSCESCSFNDQFILWTNGDTLNFLKDFGEFLDSKGGEKTKIQVFKNKNSQDAFFENIKENFSLIINLFLIVTVFLLNAINSVKYWMEKQKIKLGVKRLCGATISKIFFEVFLQYILMILFSSLGGYVFFVLSKNFLFLNKNISLSLDSFLLSFAFCFIFSLMIVFPVLIKYCKKQIVGMLR